MRDRFNFFAYFFQTARGNGCCAASSHGVNWAVIVIGEFIIRALIGLLFIPIELLLIVNRTVINLDQ